MSVLLKYFSIVLVVVSVASCNSNSEETIELPFTDILNFDTATIRQSYTGGLDKKVSMESRVESKYFANPDWVQELKPFTEANFNIPIHKDNYNITTTTGSLSNLKEVSYVANVADIPMRWAVYRFDGERCIGASISVNKQAKGYEFNELLTFLPEEGYSIDNSQNLKFLQEESFYLAGKFENKPQSWRMFFEIGQQNIPVNFKLAENDKGYLLSFIQGQEIINVQAVPTDSGYFADIPVFQSYLQFELEENNIIGTWHNLDKGANYIVPFTANPLMPEQVLQANPMANMSNLSGKWEVYFGEEGDESPAIGIFNRFGNDVIGTFATETGDYRFLQGKLEGDSFSLSTFDGSHLFLFTGILKGDKIENGKFYSGTHYQTVWSGTRNDHFELTNPDEMTEIEDGQEFSFSFPDLNGKMVSLSDEKYRDKVVVVQLLGSWCPNCMDETRYFADLHKQYEGQDIEFVGLAFERSEDFKEASESLKKSISDLNVPYPMLIAGTPRKSQEALPMIEKIKSYPTSIFIDKKGNVVKIHTGFYGPSTGEYYEAYKSETEQFIGELLAQ